MSTLSVRLKYRPIRFGWCIQRGDIEALRRAARLSFTMWGGRFNPMLVVDDTAFAHRLIKLSGTVIRRSKRRKFQREYLGTEAVHLDCERRGIVDEEEAAVGGTMTRDVIDRQLRLCK